MAASRSTAGISRPSWAAAAEATASEGSGGAWLSGHISFSQLSLDFSLGGVFGVFVEMTVTFGYEFR